MNKKHYIDRDNYRKACKFYKELELTVDSGKLYCLKAHTYCETQQPCKCSRMKRYDRIHEKGGIDVNSTIDIIITLLTILSICVMWFIIGYYKGETDGIHQERQEILNTIDSIHKQDGYIIKGGKKDDQYH